MFPKERLSIDLPAPPQVFVSEEELPDEDHLIWVGDGKVPWSWRCLTHVNVDMSWLRP